MNFDEFYRQYPKKVARRDAEKAWARMSDADRAAALENLPKHVRLWDVEGRAKAYIPYPATWLNGARWEDEIDLAESIPEKAVAWWASEKGILAKGRALSINPRGGESMQEYKARVVEGARRAA